MRRLGYALRRHGWLNARALIVGASDQGCAVAMQWQANPTSGMQVVGFVDDFKPLGSHVANGLKVLGRPSDLQRIAEETEADEVVVVSGAVAWESFEEVINHTTQHGRYTVRLSPGFYELLATGVGVTSKSFVPLLTVDAHRLVGFDSLLKALLDYALGSLCLLLASPALAAVALMHLTGRRGPVLRRSQALGRQRRGFHPLPICPASFRSGSQVTRTHQRAEGSDESRRPTAAPVRRSTRRSARGRQPRERQAPACLVPGS